MKNMRNNTRDVVVCEEGASVVEAEEESANREMEWKQRTKSKMVQNKSE